MPRRRSADRITNDAARLGYQLMLAPAVIAMRMPILAAEAASLGFTPRPESLSAVNEKVRAMTEGAMAAYVAMVRGSLMLPFAMMRLPASGGGPLMDLASEMTVAALKPAARQVSRNHKRLTTRK